MKKRKSDFSDLDILTDDIVASVIKEMRLVEDERENQKQTEERLDDNYKDNKKKRVDEDDEDLVPVKKERGEDEEEDEDQEIEVKQPSLEDFTDVELADLVDQINFVRSGKSVKDEEIMSELSTYFNRLTSGERQAFMIFISSLSQILTGDKKAVDVVYPSSLDIDVAPRKKEKEQKVVTKTGSGAIVVGNI